MKEQTQKVKPKESYFKLLYIMLSGQCNYFSLERKHANLHCPLCALRRGHTRGHNND